MEELHFVGFYGKEAPKTPFLLNRLGANCVFHGKGVKVDIVFTFWQSNSLFVDCHNLPQKRDKCKVL